MNNKQKTMMLEVTLSTVLAVRERERPGSKRETSLARGAGRVGMLVDCFRLEAWKQPDLDLAGHLVDEFNGMIVCELDTSDRGRAIWTEMLLHVGLSTFETVRAGETGSVKVRMDNGIDSLLHYISDYDIERLAPKMVARACRLGDRFESRIAEVFGYGGNDRQGVPAVQAAV